VVMIVLAAGLAQYQLNKRHIDYAETFIVDFNKSLESLQQQVNNLAKNDLIINSIIDDSNRDTYLPVFFRSLELTVTENVAILFTDFSGDIITGKNTELYLQHFDKFNWQSSVLESATGYRITLRMALWSPRLSYIPTMRKALLLLMFNICNRRLVILLIII
jgi:hypothetical protein